MIVLMYDVLFNNFMHKLYVNLYFYYIFSLELDIMLTPYLPYNFFIY
jgi:hypothetical protein